MKKIIIALFCMPIFAIAAMGPVVSSGNSVGQMQAGLSNTAPVSGAAARQAGGGAMSQTQPAYRGAGSEMAAAEREGNDYEEHDEYH